MSDYSSSRDRLFNAKHIKIRRQENLASADALRGCEGREAIYTDDSGIEQERIIASEPWQLAHGDWVIKLRGHSGGYDCGRVRLKEKTAEPISTSEPTLKRLADAGEFLWTVVANVSGGDWSKQSAEWKAAASKARDDFHAACRELKIPCA